MISIVLGSGIVVSIIALVFTAMQPCSCIHSFDYPSSESHSSTATCNFETFSVLHGCGFPRRILWEFVGLSNPLELLWDHA